MKPIAKSQNRWPLFLMGALPLAFVLLYLPALERLVRFWHRSEDYSHGFLIIPICLYLIWHKRQVLQTLPIRSGRGGMALTVVSLMVYAVAEFAGILTVASASMILTLMASVFYLFGPHILRTLLFPLVFLIFMIPVPGQVFSALTIPLQLLVSQISTSVAQFLSVPVYREGNVIHLSEHTLQVIQACSGLRSMVSLLMLSALLGHMTLRSYALQTGLIISGIPVAVVVNIVRVLAMILAFHYLDYDLTKGTQHTVLGGAIFVLALLLLMMFQRVLSKWDPSN